METSKICVYKHDYSTNANGTYLLGTYDKYYNVTISVDLVGADNIDSYVQICERTDASEPWKYPPGMSRVFDTMPDDSEDFVFGDWGSEQVGITIGKGSCTAGILTVFIESKAD